MKKRLLSTILVSALMGQVAIADGNQDTLSDERDKPTIAGKFYVSGLAGYGYGSYSNHTHHHPYIFGSTPSISNGVLGLSAGYEHFFSTRGVFGFEFTTLYNNFAKHKYKENAYESLKNKYSYGIDTKVGYLFGKCQAYGILGISWSQLAHERTVGKWMSKATNTHTGFAIGLGFEKEISPTILLGAQIKHVFYDRKCYRHQLLGGEIVNKIKPNYTYLLANVRYKF